MELGTLWGPSDEAKQGSLTRPCDTVAMVLLAPVPDREGLVNGCSSTTSVHFDQPSSTWPSVIVLTGGVRYQLDACGYNRKLIHSKEGWQSDIPPAIRHFRLHLHDLRSLHDPDNGAFSACVARRQEILDQILESQSGRTLMSMIFKDIERGVEAQQPIVVLPYCSTNTEV